MKNSHSQSPIDPGYVEALLSQETWFRAAGELLSAASQLKPAIEAYWCAVKESLDSGIEGPLPWQTVRVYQMLSGFALENLCKGALVAALLPAERATVGQTGVLPEQFRTHRLPQLLADVKFPLEYLDEHTVAYIEAATVWYGRYPVPVRGADLRETALLSGERAPTSMYSDSDHRWTQELIDRLQAHVGYIQPADVRGRSA